MPDALMVVAQPQQLDRRAAGGRRAAGEIQQIALADDLEQLLDVRGRARIRTEGTRAQHLTVAIEGDDAVAFAGDADAADVARLASRAAQDLLDAGTSGPPPILGIADLFRLGPIGTTQAGD